MVIRNILSFKLEEDGQAFRISDRHGVFREHPSLQPSHAVQNTTYQNQNLNRPITLNKLYLYLMRKHHDESSYQVLWRTKS